MPEMRRYEGRTVLVTGGGSGIGEACCIRLAAEGARVAVLDVHRAKAEAVAARLGADAIALQLDVSDAAAVETAIAEVVRRLGPLKLAVNNAGIGGARLAPDQTPLDQWERTIAVNLSGVFYCMRAEHPHLLAAGGGAIVNTASVLSVVASPSNPAYTAAKHGVLALTRSCALAWGKAGIRVNAVGPGFTPTPLTAAATDEYRAAALAQMALNQFPQPDDVAATVAFLGSDEARAVTGALYMVDAGFTIS
ncbi:MAG TPA: SDR family NAD(P)-dependent oxidoreductase [Caulobacteraceae bacterium]